MIRKSMIIICLIFLFIFPVKIAQARKIPVSQNIFHYARIELYEKKIIIVYKISFTMDVVKIEIKRAARIGENKYIQEKARRFQEQLILKLDNTIMESKIINMNLGSEFTSLNYTYEITLPKLLKEYKQIVFENKTLKRMPSDYKLAVNGGEVCTFPNNNIKYLEDNVDSENARKVIIKFDNSKWPMTADCNWKLVDKGKVSVIHRTPPLDTPFIALLLISQGIIALISGFALYKHITHKIESISKNGAKIRMIGFPILGLLLILLSIFLFPKYWYPWLELIGGITFVLLGTIIFFKRLIHYKPQLIEETEKKVDSTEDNAGVKIISEEVWEKSANDLLVFSPEEIWHSIRNFFRIIFTSLEGYVLLFIAGFVHHWILGISLLFSAIIGEAIGVTIHQVMQKQSPATLEKLLGEKGFLGWFLPLLNTILIIVLGLAIGIRIFMSGTIINLGLQL